MSKQLAKTVSVSPTPYTVDPKLTQVTRLAAVRWMYEGTEGKDRINEGQEAQTEALHATCNTVLEHLVADHVLMCKGLAETAILERCVRAKDCLNTRERSAFIGFAVEFENLFLKAALTFANVQRLGKGTTVNIAEKQINVAGNMHVDGAPV